MGKKIVAVIGSYRKGGITDQAVEAVLSAARAKGAEAEKIYLPDKKIEFCLNCRDCTNDSLEKRRGKCVLNDDMDNILSAIDNADGLILSSPVNFGTVTAVMKMFVERCVVYGYWPWGKHIPKERRKEGSKKAVLITSSACPAFIAPVLMPSALSVMKQCAGCAGAKIVKSLYFGMVCLERNQKLTKNQLRLAQSAGKALAG